MPNGLPQPVNINIFEGETSGCRLKQNLLQRFLFRRQQLRLLLVERCDVQLTFETAAQCSWCDVVIQADQAKPRELLV